MPMEKGITVVTQPNDDRNSVENPAEETFVPPPEVQGKRAVAKAVRAHKAAQKKAAAQKAPAKRAPARKAPAKKTNVFQMGDRKPPQKATEPAAKEPQDAEHPWYTRKSYTPVPGQKLYEAVGESGQIAVRSCGKPMTHAISWAHVDQPGERAKAIREGVIANFYTSEEAAEKQAVKFREANPGDRIVVVPAREYRGQ